VAVDRSAGDGTAHRGNALSGNLHELIAMHTCERVGGWWVPDFRFVYMPRQVADVRGLRKRPRGQVRKALQESIAWCTGSDRGASVTILLHL
jgi:hypothetical protein